MASRVKNTASVKELAKCLKANLKTGLDEQLFLSGDMDSTCGSLEALLEDMFHLTLRPTVSILTDAMAFAYNGYAKGNVKPMAQAVVNCYSHIRSKVYSVSTGKKLSEPVARLVSLLRKLQSRTSDASSAGLQEESQDSPGNFLLLSRLLPQRLQEVSKKSTSCTASLRCRCRRRRQLRAGTFRPKLRWFSPLQKRTAPRSKPPRRKSLRPPLQEAAKVRSQQWRRLSGTPVLRGTCA